MSVVGVGMDVCCGYGYLLWVLVWISVVGCQPPLSVGMDVLWVWISISVVSMGMDICCGCEYGCLLWVCVWISVMGVSMDVFCGCG